MTDLRARLAEVLRQRINELNHWPLSFEQLLDVLLSLPNIAIVELVNKPDDWDLKIVEGGYVQDMSPSDFRGTPNDTRAFAAALLAAADAAEKFEQIADLEREWKHASKIALASVEQSDYADNIAYRNQLAAELRELKGDDDES